MSMENGGPKIPVAGAVDLGGLKKVESPGAELAQVEAEKRLGMRCHGCGERIEIGLILTQFRATSDAGQQVMGVAKFAACTRPECGFAELAASEAAVMETVEYAWLDERREALAKPVESADPPGV